MVWKSFNAVTFIKCLEGEFQLLDALDWIAVVHHLTGSCSDTESLQNFLELLVCTRYFSRSFGCKEKSHP